MKVRLYLNDWFYNMGLIGFRRILEFGENNGKINLAEYRYAEKENFIEFEKNLLTVFHHLYFDYFLDKYDIAKREKKQIEKLINMVQMQEKFKEALENIKRIIKANNDKIKKIDPEIYKRADEVYKSVGKIKKIEEFNKLENLLNEFLQIMSIREINKRLTLNKFKSVLSDNFFGQRSFLNVTHTNRSLEEQKEIMYRDFIIPIFDSIELVEILNDVDDTSKIIEFLSNKKSFKSLSKKIRGIKTIEEIKDFIDNEIDNCCLCGCYKSLGANYEEGDFIPLAVSADNAKNMFWNLNVKYPICPLCKLILFCTPAGCTNIYKSYLGENYDIKDKEYFAFVNIDTNFENLYKTNEFFYKRRDYDIPFNELILDIINTAKERSVWQLQNILYVEFNANYNSKNCKMNYFNIPKYLAWFFKEKIYLINAIQDKNFKMQLMDKILSNKDIKSVIDGKIREIITKNLGKAMDCFNAVIIRMEINKYKNLKKEVVDLAYRDLNMLFEEGQKMNSFLQSQNAENKINSIAYRLLNATKSGNKKDFMDAVIRLYMSCDKAIPSLFLEVMTEKSLSFEDISYAFISGLLNSKNKKFEKGEEM